MLRRFLLTGLEIAEANGKRPPRFLETPVANCRRCCTRRKRLAPKFRLRFRRPWPPAAGLAKVVHPLTGRTTYGLPKSPQPTALKSYDPGVRPGSDRVTCSVGNRRASWNVKRSLAISGASIAVLLVGTIRREWNRCRDPDATHSSPASRAGSGDGRRREIADVSSNGQQLLLVTSNPGSVWSVDTISGAVIRLGGSAIAPWANQSPSGSFAAWIPRTSLQACPRAAYVRSASAGARSSRVSSPPRTLTHRWMPSRSRTMGPSRLASSLSRSPLASGADDRPPRHSTAGRPRQLRWWHAATVADLSQRTVFAGCGLYGSTVGQSRSYH